MRRRIAVRMRARGVHTFAEYGRVLDRDRARVRSAPGCAHHQRHEVLSQSGDVRGDRPRDRSGAVRARRAAAAHLERGLRVGRGAVLAGDAHAPLRRARSGKRFDRVDVLGTDLDRASLAAAERATYLEPTLADTPAELRQLYFPLQPPYRIHRDVRARVQFRRHDLLREPFPESQHLIVCRNVIIYFDRATQEELFERFAAALLPGGFLVLGRVETLFGPARTMFAPVDSRERLFRRT